MRYCVDLADVCDPLEVGAKFAGLARVHRLVRVPPTICITAGALRASLSESFLQAYRTLVLDAEMTVGAFLRDADHLMLRLDEPGDIAEGVLDDVRRSVLAVAGAAGKVAVRSSATHEDGARHSFAGVYQSTLNVQASSTTELTRAIVSCWRSYFNADAIAARLMAGCLEAEPRYGVVVQRMVAAVVAGVAFRDEDGPTTIELVEGLGEKLVSGNVAPMRHREGQPLAPSLAKWAPALEQVQATAQRLSEALEHGVDIEWAWDGQQLWVVQVRPITVGIGETHAERESGILLARLYENESLPKGLRLRQCSSVFAQYQSKRSQAYRVARSAGAVVGRGWVLDLAPDMCAAAVTALEADVNYELAEELVLDAGDRVRQVILPRDELAGFLRQAFAGLRSRATVVVREFIRGECGVISQLLDDGSLLLEWASGGLLGINRGLCTPHRIIARQVAGTWRIVYCDVDPPVAISRQLDVAQRTTRELCRQLGETQCEWVLHEDRLVFLDFSRVEKSLSLSTAGGTSMSSGVATGPVLNVKASALLERLSYGAAISVTHDNVDISRHPAVKELFDAVELTTAPPILVLDKPYAVIAPLLPLVGGIVCREGSLLCHLAIQLRERGVPGVIVPEFSAQDGVVATIDGETVHYA